MNRRIAVIFFALVACLLAACGDKSETSPPALQALANVAATPPPPAGAFALVSAAAEPYENRPAITLVFSRPLVGQQSFDQLLSIKLKDGAPADGSWILEDRKSTRLNSSH